MLVFPWAIITLHVCGNFSVTNISPAAYGFCKSQFRKRLGCKFNFDLKANLGKGKAQRKRNFCLPSNQKMNYGVLSLDVVLGFHLFLQHEGCNSISWLDEIELLIWQHMTIDRIFCPIYLSLIENSVKMRNWKKHAKNHWQHHSNKFADLTLNSVH